MTHTKHGFLAACCLGLLTVDAAADTESKMLLVEQLRCHTPPQPSPALIALIEAGEVEEIYSDQYDSISCFPTNGNLDLFGINVAYVCAFDEDTQAHASFPDLYYRGPGTSPGTLIEILVDASEQELHKWAEFHGLGEGPFHESRLVSPGSGNPLFGVICDRWSVR